MKFQSSVREKCFVFLIAIFAVTLLDVLFDYRLHVKRVLSPHSYQDKSFRYVIKYEPCKEIPAPPAGMKWPEEAFLNDPEVQDLRDLADPMTSRSWLLGNSSVKIGDVVTVRVDLYDARGYRKTQGGDLIRVWIRESELDAAAVAMVTDHNNGSYTATTKAFWVGRPVVKIAIISPREIIAAQFKRRYMCPPVLMNSGIFRHPTDPDITEETPCNYDNHIPGYNGTCNFTEENYRRPWYCGKPRRIKTRDLYYSKNQTNHFTYHVPLGRHPRLMCADWVAVSDVNMWKKGIEQNHLSSIDRQLFSLNYSSRLLKRQLRLNVKSDGASKQIFAQETCNKDHVFSTWRMKSPVGYLFNCSWVPVYCKPHFRLQHLSTCLKDKHVRLVGDSTSRQIFESLQKLTNCMWLTDSWSQGLKHRPAECVNTAINFSLTLELPPLPFCTHDAPRHYFKSFSARLYSISDNVNTVVILHMYAHVLNYHSHVFFETIKDMKIGITELLTRNSRVKVVVKGPHAYSFSRSSDHVIWMPDVYAKIYSDFLYNEFNRLHDRVIYLNALDITIATEQWHIHAEEYVVQEMISHIFNFIC